MDKQVQWAAGDRETRRWIFDAIAWLLGIVLAALLVAEAAAGERGAASSRNDGASLRVAVASRPAGEPGEGAVHAARLPQ
jgi:hypothetical protein